MEKEKTSSQIGIRVTPTFRERVEKRATEEGRTVANLITKIVNDYLDNIDEAKKILKQ